MIKYALMVSIILISGMIFWSCSDDNKSTEPVNKVPECKITFPPDSAKVTIGTNLNITLDASDEDGSIAELKLYLNEQELTVKSDTLYLYSLSTDQMTPGIYDLKAVAKDNDGSETIAEISIELTSDKTVVLISPNGGEIWPMGTSQLIKWQSNLSEQVKIDLLKNGEFSSNIVSGTANDGEYSWAIPATLELSENYSVKISGVNSEGINDESNAEISIITTPGDPFITLISPNDSDNLLVGETKEITWASNMGGEVKIELYKGGSFLNVIQKSINSGSFSWVIPNTILDGNDYKIRISSISNDQVSDMSDNNINIKRFYLTSQMNQAVLEPETAYNISWINSDFLNSSNVLIELRKNGVFFEDIANNIVNTGNYAWTLPFSVSSGENYQIRIRLNNDPAIYDDSEGVLEVAEKIKVISPAGSESLLSGRAQVISWTDNISEDVKIELFKGEVFNSVISSSTPSDGNYSWAVPLNQIEGADYKIKVTKADSDEVYSISNNNFTILNPSLVLTYPTGGQNWNVGSSQTITWTDNLTENVKIELYKGLTLNTVISSSTASDGNYQWTVPAEFPAGTDYKIKISSTLYSAIVDDSDTYFTVPTSISIVLPNGSESWLTGTTIAIGWSDNISENVKIELFKGSVLNSVISSSTESDGAYNWLIPLSISSGTDYKIKISGTTSSASDESNQNFTINESIKVTSPNGGETINAGSSHTITWIDYLSENVKIDLYKNGVFNTTIASSVPSSGSYNWTVPYTVSTGGDYKIRISSTLSSAIYDESGAYFQIPATIVIISPNGGEDWQTGYMKEISWIDNISENVSIEVYKGGSLNFTINASTLSDGVYNWEIPKTLSNGSDYKIKITSATNSQVFDESNADIVLNDGMIFVQGGTFQMGDYYDESWTGAETPVHSVTVSDFYIGKCEITQYEWSRYLALTNTSYGAGNEFPAYSLRWYYVLKYCNLRSSAEGFTPCYSINGSTNPVDWGDVPTTSTDADWDAAVCDWSANGYRMPTEAEWEYAARGGINSGDNYRYSGSDVINDVGWYSDNCSSTNPVGTKSPNQLGIYDMTGNVSEWCWDWFGYPTNYYQTCYDLGTVTNPLGANTVGARIQRGGYWDYAAIGCRVAWRDWEIPWYYYQYYGCRVVRKLK
jgi:formylglycine-generating enzyme required for sulfatase activity